MNNSNVIVIGYGSIGTRHARVLNELGCHVAVVSRRPIDYTPSYTQLDIALEKEKPGYIVIANETNQHHPTLNQLAEYSFSGKILVEKPLYESSQSTPKTNTDQCFVGYNLRFHPVITALREQLSDQTILSVQMYAGQYLPEWRPESDYRQSYSAQAKLGGGVLRDLSHELDMLNWLFGPWKRLSALGGKVSQLEIDSDDSWAILLNLEQCPMATLQINYLDRATRRDILINTEQHTYYGDLINGEIKCDGTSRTVDAEVDQTYSDMHQAVLAGQSKTLCTLNDGAQVVEMIEAVEQAASCRSELVRDDDSIFAAKAAPTR